MTGGLGDLKISKAHSDVYKAFAIAIILICHFTGTFLKGATTVFTPLGGIGVAMFLLLSGYGLNESWNGRKKPYAGWWRKRVISVWIPYVIVQAALYWPFHEFSFSALALDLFLVKPMHMHGWYLQYLFVWYIVFYAVRRTRLTAAGRLAVFAAVSAALFAVHNVFPGFLNPSLCAEQAFSFFAGVLLSEKKDMKLDDPKKGAIVLAIGVAFLALKQLPAVRSAPGVVMNAVQLMIKLPCALGFIMLVHRFVSTKKLTAIQAFGRISYPLYLIHGYVLAFVSVTPLGAVLFFAISIAGAFVFNIALDLLKPLENKLFCLPDSK